MGEVRVSRLVHLFDKLLGKQLEYSGFPKKITKDFKMFSNLFLVAGIAIILWVGLFVFYLSSSQRHQSIEKELNELEILLGPEEHDE